MTQARLWLTIPLLAVVLAGCTRGNPNAPARVSGKITYKGATVPGGTVTFISADSGTYPAAISPDGTYTATDIPIGDMVVIIETETVNKDKKKPSYAGPGGKGAGMSPMPEGASQGGGNYVKIPAKYGDRKLTPLKATLEKGKNTKDFELTD